MTQKLTLFERLIELSSSEKVWLGYFHPILYMSVHNMHAFMSKSLRPSLIHLSVFKSARVCSSEPFRVSLSQRRGIVPFCMCSLLQLWSKRHINMLYLTWPLNNTNPIPLAWLSRTNLISISQYHTPTVVKRLASLLEMLVELNEWRTID